jgi:lipoprotein
MITKEEFEEAVNCCTGFTVSCENCPLSEKDFKCGVYLAEYLKENEPAPAATGTSSEILKNINSTHLDDSTKSDICQAYDTVDEACTDIIDIYEGMSACERRAFDIGEVYGKICSTRDKLENMRGGDDK